MIHYGAAGHLPITARIEQPTPAEVRQARENANLSQAQAASLISSAVTTPYRTWQGYEVPVGQRGHRQIPLSAWELFLLMSDQHVLYRLKRR